MKVYVNGEKYEEVLVEIVVEQKSFYVPLNKLMMFPDSYFCVALKPHWRCKDSDTVVVDGNEQYKLIVTDRSASLFRLIAMYLELGEVPRDKQGECLFDSRLFELLREEADYYCLSALVSELNELLKIKTAALIEAKKYVCDELQLSKGCVIGRDMRWFESEDIKYGEHFYEMKNQCYRSIIGACTFWLDCCDYQIIVDSDTDNGDRYEYDAGGDVIFLPCFKKLEDHYGTARLEVSEEYNEELTTTCFVGLGLAPHKYKLKLIQLQYMSPEGIWTIDDEECVKESEAAIGYVIVRHRSYGCLGGKLLLNRDDGWEHFQNAVCFYGADNHEISPVTSGDVRVLVFAIVPGNSEQLVNWSVWNASQMKGVKSYDFFLKSLFDHVNNRFVFGVYTKHYYSDTRCGYTPFTIDTLQYTDKCIVNYAKANNIPVSLVFVRVSEDGTVRILDSPNHKLLECHQNVNNIQFISLPCCTIYRLDTSRYEYINRVDVKEKISRQFVAAAFILG